MALSTSRLDMLDEEVSGNSSKQAVVVVPPAAEKKKSALQQVLDLIGEDSLHGLLGICIVN